MLNRIGNFIMYHNGFTILLWLVLISGGTALAANPDVREAVGASVIQSNDRVAQIDNSLIVNADIDQFDFELQVTEVAEDEYTYYVSYTYRTLEVRDGVWQVVYKDDLLTIVKPQLGDVDFETYAQRQLAEFIESQRQLLAETQNIEKMLGQTPLVVERSYSGLVGRFLDTKEIISEQNAAKAALALEKPDLNQTATSTTGIGSSTATSTATSTTGSTATSTATSSPSTGGGGDQTDPGDTDPPEDPPEDPAEESGGEEPPSDPEPENDPAPSDDNDSGSDGGGGDTTPAGGSSDGATTE